MSDFDELDTLMNLSELHVYSVPKSQLPGEYKAKFWGKDNDLSQPYFTGNGKVIIKNEILYIQIFRKNNDTSKGNVLFATCPIDLSKDDDKYDSKLMYFCEPVTDSSRYYVLRIRDPSGKREAKIGIGFSERDDSSNFLMCLQDQVRYIKRARLAGEDDIFDLMSKDFEGDDNTSELVDRPDYSIREGDTIKINLGKSKKKKSKKSKSSQSTGFLAPPPAVIGGESLANDDAVAGVATTKSNSELNEFEDDEWGDFTTTASVTSTNETVTSNATTIIDDDWGDFTTA